MKKRIFEVSKEDLIEELASDTEEARTCCGVLELGAIGDYQKLTGLGIMSYEVDSGSWYRSERKATIQEIKDAFKGLHKEWSNRYGMAICYLLPEQVKGVFGQLIKENGWENTGSFWNPNTRNTLTVWTKIFHKKAPRASGKSAFRR